MLIGMDEKTIEALKAELERFIQAAEAKDITKLVAGAQIGSNTITDCWHLASEHMYEVHNDEREDVDEIVLKIIGECLKVFKENTTCPYIMVLAAIRVVTVLIHTHSIVSKKLDLSEPPATN